MGHPVTSYQEGPTNGGSGSGEHQAEVVRSCRWGALRRRCSLGLGAGVRVLHNAPAPCEAPLQLAGPDKFRCRAQSCAPLRPAVSCT